VTRAYLSLQFLWGWFLRRDDLLKPDVMSEAILLGACALVFAVLILVVIVALK
jgi:hypothetical protein